MSKKANPTLIGFFLLGAIALVIGGLLFFGGGEYFKEKQSYMLYFEGSVKGLNIGSPVNFRGVPIGKVTSIKLLADQDSMEIRIPVIIEIDPESFTFCCDEQGREQGRPLEHDDAVAVLVQKGLRAQLQMQSFVTGQKMVEFDFHPASPLVFVGLDRGYHEIPTLPSTIVALTEKLGKLPADELFEKTLSVVESLDNLLNAPETTTIMANLDKSLVNLEQITGNVDQEFKVLFQDLSGTLAEARKLLKNVDAEVKPLSKSGQEVALATQQAVERAEEVLTQLRNSTAENSNMNYELFKALTEIRESARAIRLLSESLETYPDSLLRGKAPAKKGE